MDSDEEVLLTHPAPDFEDERKVGKKHRKRCKRNLYYYAKRNDKITE